MNTELKNYAIDFGTKLGGLLAIFSVIGLLTSLITKSSN
jgi:hypothetical protein